MIGYKVFREYADGSIGPLFINKKMRLQPGVVYPMEEHLTKGFAFRPGWHICKTPNAPHLSMKNRAWYKVSFERLATIKRPESQGGIWYLGKTIKVIEKYEHP